MNIVVLISVNFQISLTDWKQKCSWNLQQRRRYDNDLRQVVDDEVCPVLSLVPRVVQGGVQSLRAGYDGHAGSVWREFIHNY